MLICNIVYICMKSGRVVNMPSHSHCFRIFIYNTYTHESYARMVATTMSTIDRKMKCLHFRAPHTRQKQWCSMKWNKDKTIWKIKTMAIRIHYIGIWICITYEFIYREFKHTPWVSTNGWQKVHSTKLIKIIVEIYLKCFYNIHKFYLPISINIRSTYIHPYQICDMKYLLYGSCAYVMYTISLVYRGIHYVYPQKQIFYLHKTHTKNVLNQ